MGGSSRREDEERVENEESNDAVTVIMRIDAVLCSPASYG
jgi:hypothetical protein